MRAILPNSNIEIEGDPAELAQLARILQSGDMLVEHVHRFRIVDVADENGAQTGSCTCGVSRQFTPWADNAHTQISLNGKTATQNSAAAGRKCRTCGQAGHRKDKCPQRTSE
jgi:hypothetical protein